MAERRPEPTATQRLRLAFRGRVQGVGFRPWLYRLATEEGLAGHVGNDLQGAFAEIEGEPAAVARFLARTEREAPPLVEIAARDEEALAPTGEREFRILSSRAEGEARAEIAPDSATCPDCLRELFDPADRRYRYPFINCTNCGPRYSIVRGLPYDRPLTTMAAFTMCPRCQAEYDSPADRRFHAQPNACPDCGPRLWLADALGREAGGEPIAQAQRCLAEGEILAIKGLGGFHLACRADDETAVAALRSRKGREAKPLALMVADLAAARALVALDAPSEALLESVARPIVLAPARAGTGVAPGVAPGSHTLGLMLPYTPLHHLLFAPDAKGRRLGPLVMTSGNPSEEPLCTDNDEAIVRLRGIADAFLLHDRNIARRVDDSVALALRLPAPGGGEAARTLPLRRARGFAPAPIVLGRAFATPVLALGGELKSAVCFLAGDQALLSEHLGELENPAAYRNFLAATERLGALLGATPALLACDLHPDYGASRHARSLPLPRVEVQHHHAHVVSCLADNGLPLDEEVLGLACDGTGYGEDGSIWGCELLRATATGYERLGHLRPFVLLGGDAAARETWRPAAALLAQAYGDDWLAAAPAAATRVAPAALAVAARWLAAPAPPGPLTSSLGRLFDAAAFLLGLCEFNGAEAQAAMALEAAAARHGAAPALPLPVFAEAEGLVLDPRPLIRALVEGRAAGRSAGELAAGFHAALARGLAELAAVAAAAGAPRRVLLSGGCFANRILTEALAARLKAGGLEVYIHHRVPTSDGGLALGQALVAAAQAEPGLAPLIPDEER
ncbi:carbamoyltransferase HypF [bacterium]|nr:carbamoyltransferase HypF [bacterium]